jgi:hypothetical protein
MEMGFDGAVVHAGGLADFVEFHLVDEAHEEDGALVGGEGLEGG